MSKPKLSVELQVILRDVSIAESDSGRALEKVHKRAALQVNDYLHILLIKFEASNHDSTSLETSIAETRRALDCVHQAEQSGDDEHEADVVV
jgi:hypothetical protein